MATSTKHHILSILALPFNVLITIPTLILYFSQDFNWGLGFKGNQAYFFYLLAILLIFIGLYLMLSTIRLFANVGKGTLAPWNPTQKLVVKGVYKRVRNPMITGVLLILLGETIFFGSTYLLLWFLLFFFVKHIYFLLSEEPELQKRFGTSYERYRQNVPRWLPRLQQWQDEAKEEMELENKTN
ncbi:MAG: isoprenylcysteine carboxylmethyltransferase family protein [Chitinophagales bacterium]